MDFTSNNFSKKLIIIFFFILYSCKLQEPIKSHGILFLENRAKKLNINTTNQNDVISIFGYPHIEDEKNWIYFERVFSRGQYHRLGQNVLKENNILILEFNKFGILEKKQLFNKNDIKKISFSEKKTDNNLSKRSFVQTLLQSIKQKMYSK